VGTKFSLKCLKEKLLGRRRHRWEDTVEMNVKIGRDFVRFGQKASGGLSYIRR
jgi:hypothetical protein